MNGIESEATCGNLASGGSFVKPTDDLSVEDEKHRVGIPLSVLNLTKNIIGTSMLSMSFGVACSGVVFSVVICLIFAVLSAYTFGLIGQLCGEAKVQTFRGVCEKFIHPKAGVWTDVLLAVYTLPACIAYSIFVCDCMRKMIVHLAPAMSGNFLSSRAFIAIVLTVCILMPLCSISRLDKLTFTSIIGIAAIIYCYVFVAVDLGQNTDQAYPLSKAMWWPPSGSPLGLFPMANIYAACYLVQYNSPKFFHELRNPTRFRFFSVSFITNAIVAVFCGSFAILGFARFGLSVPDNLLVAYDQAYVVWVATCVSVITTYPFVFDAGRRSLLSALSGWKHYNERKFWWIITTVLIPVFSLIAVFIDSLGLVVGLNGSLCGITVGFTLPGLLLARRARMHKNRKQEIAGYILTVFGVLMTVLGLLSIFLHVTPTEV
jgi:amino acid permease